MLTTQDEKQSRRPLMQRIRQISQWAFTYCPIGQSYVEFIPNQYDCLYTVYLEKIYPSVCRILTARHQEESYERRKVLGLNTILHYMVHKENGLSFDDYQEVQMAPYDFRVRTLCDKLIYNADPWGFHCLLEALQFHQAYYFKNAVKKHIMRIYTSHYHGLINSVSEYGHTLSLGGDIRLNVHDTEKHKARFVDMRSWIGQSHMMPMIDGVSMSEEEFIRFVCLFDEIMHVRSLHGVFAIKNPLQGLDESVLPMKWKLGPRMVVLLTGTKRLLPGHLPGISILGGGHFSHNRHFLRLCSAGRNSKCSPWYILTVQDRKNVEHIAFGTVMPIYAGRKKYVSLI